MAGRSWKVRGFVVGALLFVALALGACSNDLDALYAHAGKAAPDAGSGASKAVPILPALPDPDNVPACEACVQDQCSDARASCLEDDACTAMLACKGACSDPACLRRCEYENASSPWYDDYFVCAMRTRCTARCRGGENWGCARKYEWPVAEQSQFRERFSFSIPPRIQLSATDSRANVFLVGAAVRACSGVPCQDSGRLDSGTVDSENGVEFELRLGFGNIFEGFLELEDPNIRVGVRDHFYGLPIWRPGEVVAIVPPRDFLFGGVLGDLAPSFDFATAAPLAVYVSDCLGVGLPPDSVKTTLPGAPELTPAYYSPSTASVSTGAPPTGFAVFTDVPPALRQSPLTVQVSRIDSGEVIAQRRVSVAAGWITHVTAYP